MPEPVSLIALATVATVGGAGCLRETRSRTSGVSIQAEFVVNAARELVDRNDQTASIAGHRATVLSDLHELAAEHSQPGWDGGEAPPVSAIAIKNASNLILALPSSVPNPELAVDPDDGAIALEWCGGPSRIFSVSVGNSTRMACAGIDGGYSWHGVAPYGGATVSDFVLQGIQRVLG